MLSPGTYLSHDWYRSQDGREIISSLLQRNLSTRKTFGLLEKPNVPAYVEEVTYKIFLVGKSGVGKTSTIAKLSGNTIPVSHSETAGIQTTTVYWPGKIQQFNKIIMFKLQFWDAGEGSLKKFDHVQPACLDKLDCTMYLFSFVDKSSFDDIPQNMGRFSGPKDNTCKIIMGTKFDQHAHTEITQRDIRDFEQNWKIPILKIRNIPDNDGKTDFNDVAQILNIICEHLWYRDVLISNKTEEGKISYC